MIVGGFAGGGDSISSKKKNVCQVMHIASTPLMEKSIVSPKINLSIWYAKGFIPLKKVSHGDYPTNAELECQKGHVGCRQFSWCLILGLFEGLNLDPELVQPFKGSLVGFLGE